MRILIFESGLGPSSPAHTWSAALTRAGATCKVVTNSALRSAQDWQRIVRLFDLIVVTTYKGFNRRELALLALAALQKPLVRAWVGTDVLNANRFEASRRRAQLLDRFVSLNLAKGEHLVSELRSIGISSIRATTVIEPPVTERANWADPLPSSCLVYLPSSRRDFYGVAGVERAIQSSPQVRFTIVGDTDHSLAHYNNVESLGWVSGMETVWPKVGAVLRLTEHDGTPRMALEALARGKVVIYSWPLEGCVLADTDAAVDAALAQLGNGTARANPEAAATLFDSRNAWLLRGQLEAVLGVRTGAFWASGALLSYACLRGFDRIHRRSQPSGQ